MKKYLKLIRIQHWVKNGLIFLPLVFGGKLFEWRNFYSALIACISFSLAASFIYIINDIKDVEKDRMHPTKCRRPLASGEISIPNAKKLCIILVALTNIGCYMIKGFDIRLILLLYIYILTNIFYSLKAKNIALLDVFILVIGYIIRIYFGAVAVDVIVSPWLYLTVLFMAFFLGLGKRRNEILKQGVNLRRVLQQYTSSFLDKNMYMCLGLTIVFYSLWCEEVNTVRGNSKMLFTIPLVVIICMKYSLTVENKSSDGDPMEVLFADKILIGLILLYCMIMFLILYVY